MNVRWCHLAVALFANAASASSTLGEVAVSPENGLQCVFSLAPSGSSVLVVSESSFLATMHVDGKTVELQAHELQCTTNCVSPGRRGVRRFKLTGHGIYGTLTKHAFCNRDSEVCAGMFAGTARLSIQTARGKLAVIVHHPDCGL
jgi:hypothetical protein